MRRRVEEVDGRHDAILGFDEVVAVETGQLAQARHQGLVDLLGQFDLAVLVHVLIASNSYMHRVLLISKGPENPDGLSSAQVVDQQNDNEKECTFYWERPMGRSKTHHKNNFWKRAEH